MLPMFKTLAGSTTLENDSMANLISEYPIPDSPDVFDHLNLHHLLHPGRVDPRLLDKVIDLTYIYPPEECV